MSKGISTVVAVIGVVIILALGGAVYLWSQNNVTPSPVTEPPPLVGVPAPDPTANWKTYRNEEYGFEFRYPPDLDLIEGSSVSVIMLMRQGERQQGTENPGIIFSVDSNEGNLSLKDYYDGDPGINLFGFPNDGKFTEREVGAVRAYEFNPIVSFAGEVDVVVPVGSKFVFISDVGSSFQANGIFDQILSTFRFIK